MSVQSGQPLNTGGGSLVSTINGSSTFTGSNAATENAAKLLSSTASTSPLVHHLTNNINNNNSNNSVNSSINHAISNVVVANPHVNHISSARRSNSSSSSSSSSTSSTNSSPFDLDIDGCLDLSTKPKDKSNSHNLVNKTNLPCNLPSPLIMGDIPGQGPGRTMLCE